MYQLQQRNCFENRNYCIFLGDLKFRNENT